MRAVIFSLFVAGVAVVATRDVSAERDGTPYAFAKAAADQVDSAVRAANNRFAGVWKLVGEETRDAKGDAIPGPNDKSGGRVGYIVYDPGGYVSVTLAWPSRPELAGRQPTPDEARVAMSTYNSYWGSFAVNESGSIVTHQTFGALSPSFSGTNQHSRQCNGRG